MRAISQQSLGGPEVPSEVDVDRPEPRPVEVLVRVHAAGVNPADWEARANGWGGKVEWSGRYGEAGGVADLGGPGTRSLR
jgi:NADPH:quinone reductase-like Zn-dependent oxidoreductase